MSGRFEHYVFFLSGLIVHAIASMAVTPCVRTLDVFSLLEL